MNIVPDLQSLNAYLVCIANYRYSRDSFYQETEFK